MRYSIKVLYCEICYILMAKFCSKDEQNKFVKDTRRLLEWMLDVAPDDKKEIVCTTLNAYWGSWKSVFEEKPDPSLEECIIKEEERINQMYQDLRNSFCGEECFSIDAVDIK